MASRDHDHTASAGLTEAVRRAAKLYHELAWGDGAFADRMYSLGVSHGYEDALRLLAGEVSRLQPKSTEVAQS